MARVAPAMKNTKPMVAKPKLGHPAAAVTKAAAKPAKAAVAAKPIATAKAKPPAAAMPVATKRQAVPVPAPMPKLSKDELRAQVEKLEQANAVLRTKSRDTNKAAKAAAQRIAELKQQVAQLEKAAARPAPASAGPKPKAVAATPGKRQAHAINPGNALPPGVAVGEPAPMDEEAEAALESPEQNLKGGE